MHAAGSPSTQYTLISGSARPPSGYPFVGSFPTRNLAYIVGSPITTFSTLGLLMLAMLLVRSFARQLFCRLNQVMIWVEGRGSVRTAGSTDTP